MRRAILAIQNNLPFAQKHNQQLPTPEQKKKPNDHNDNLVTLKQLWMAKTSEDGMKEAMWSIHPHLPIEFQRPVIIFSCEDMDNSMQGHPLGYIAKMFKNLDKNFNLLEKLQEFVNFSKFEYTIENGRNNILLYNLACLYERNNYDVQALRTIDKIKGLQFFTNTLKNRLMLKKMQKSKNQDMIHHQKSIQRFKKIAKIYDNIDWFKTQNNCTLHELFNIGLASKKKKKYKSAITIFNYVFLQVSQQQKLSLLCSINIAECHYLLGKIKKGVDQLKFMLDTGNIYLEPYIHQVKSKIRKWESEQNIMDLAETFTEEVYEEAHRLLKTIGKKQFQKERGFLSNKQLMFLHEKNKELNKLVNRCSIQTDMKICKTARTLKIYQKQKKSFRKYTFNKIPQRASPIKNQPQKQNNRLTLPQTKAFPRRNVSKLQSLNTQFLQNINSAVASFNSSSSISRKSQQNASETEENMIEHYWAIIKNSKDNNQIAQNYLCLGDIYKKQNDSQNALQMYRKALDKGRYEAYGRIGNIYYYSGKSAAVDYFQKYLRYVDDSDQQILLKMLHCYSKNPQNYRKAVQKLKEMLQKNPHDKQALILCATVLMKQSYFQKAIQMCNQFKQLNFMCHQNHHLLGLLYKLSNKKKQSFDSFICALRVNPSYVPALIELTQLTEISNFQPELFQIYKKALKINSQKHQILQILKNLVARTPMVFKQLKHVLNFSQLVSIGDFFLDKQMTDLAGCAYKEAEKYTNNTLLKQKLGNLYYFNKDYTKAETYFKQSQKRKPVFKIQVKLGHTMLKQNKFKEAQAIFEECVTKQNENKSIYLNMLGQCEFGLGNYDKAMKRFEESSNMGYHKKVNFYWQNACRKKIVGQMIKNKQHSDSLLKN